MKTQENLKEISGKFRGNLRKTEMKNQKKSEKISGKLR
jgi:hypothetical protein